jgi:hypothetical protein
MQVMKRSYFLLCAAIFWSAAVSGQQHVIADKNKTRPEVENHFRNPVGIARFTAVRNNGYNEIRWSAIAENDVRKYIVEFTEDGVNYQAGAEVMSNKGVYEVKHETFSMLPMLYRLRIEELNGKFQYSANILLEGDNLSPVIIYPTIVTGNVVNIDAGFPVERITVVNGSGQQVYTQEVGGRTDYMRITIPQLAKGMYWMSFNGQGWRSTEKFIVD